MIGYYIVINAKTGASREPYVHHTLESAQTEAARIAQIDKGAKVYVLEVVGLMKATDATWEGAGRDQRDDRRYDALKQRGPGSYANGSSSWERREWNQKWNLDEEIPF